MSEPGRKPRVLVLTSTFPRWHGDTEPRFVLDLCRHLSDSAEIRVLAPHFPGAARDEVLEGVRVLRYRYFFPVMQGLAYEGGIVARLRANPLRALQLPFLVAALWWSAWRAVRTWNPDLIHAHWIIPQGLVACLLPGSHVPVLCTSHGGDLHGLSLPLIRRLKAWTLRRCRRVTVVSGTLLEETRSLVPEVRVDVAPMGTDLTNLFVPPKDPHTRGTNEIVFVGRLVENKGVVFLLEAFARVTDSHPGAHLTVVGDGPSRLGFEELADKLAIGNRVKFVGSVPHSHLPAMYQRAAVAVFPFAAQEGFGLVVIEAMGCGCPVIAADIPAIRENLTPGKTGLLVPPRDVIALTKAIERLLADPGLRSSLAESARRDAKARFEWPRVAQAYSEIISGAICPG